MPNYTFYDELEHCYTDKTMSIAEMEEYLKLNIHVKWVPRGAPPTLDSVRLGRKKPDEGFRDILRTVKKGSPRSTVNTF